MTPENTSESGKANISRMRIERGAVAMGTDGPLGSVEQIVMDENTGELRAIVVSRGADEVEIAATHIVPGSAVGRQLDLDIGMVDIRANPELARPYDPKRYVPVHEDLVLPTSDAESAALYSERPVVTGIRANAAEFVLPGAGSGQDGAVSGNSPDGPAIPSEASADDQPTLTLRAQRSLTGREQELDTAPPPIDVEPPITPDAVAATAAEIARQTKNPAEVRVSDETPPDVQESDEPPADVTTTTASASSETSGGESAASAADDDIWAAEASTPDSGEERHEDAMFVSERQFRELADDPAASEPYAAEEDDFMFDPESSNVRNLRSMGDSVWVAVPPMEETEPWQHPDYRWRSYNFDLNRPNEKWGIVMGGVLGVIAAVGTVLLLRRASRRKVSRALPGTANVGQTARDLARATRRQTLAAKDSLPAALDNMAGTARKVRRAASDLPGRWRWFRRGVRVGAAVAVPIAQVQLTRRKSAQESAARQAAEVTR